MIKTYVKGKTVKLSENFESKEFDCKGKGCCSNTLIDEQLVSRLQKIREHFGKSITINSGYRCAKHNAAEDGAKNSNHVKGMAADIVVKGVAPEEVAKYAESIGVKGIGLYNWGCHTDTRTVKSFWKGDKGIAVNTFGGNVNSRVLEFQKAANADGFSLVADGIWGQNTEAVAKKAICKKQFIGYKYPNLTKIIQKAVGVTVDGKFGNDTKNAVIKWQKLFGLVADGVVGIDTWKKILGR